MTVFVISAGFEGDSVSKAENFHPNPQTAYAVNEMLTICVRCDFSPD